MAYDIVDFVRHLVVLVTVFVDHVRGLFINITRVYNIKFELKIFIYKI